MNKIILIISVLLIGCGSGNSISSVDKAEKWPNGEIYYTFQHDSLDIGAMENIRFAMATIQFKTDGHIVFIEIDYNEYLSGIDMPCVEISSSNTLNKATIGFMSDPYLILSNVNDKNNITHELMHIIGFNHEIQRHDRDNYVIIAEENIRKGQEHNFDKIDMIYDINAYDFDIESITMYTYDNDVFSSNGKDTIIYKDGYSYKRVNSLTALDIAKIKSVYPMD